MSEEIQTQGSDTTQETVPETTVQDTPKEIQIPKSRFDEVNREKKELAAELAEFKTKKAEEDGNWKQLAETRLQELEDVKNRYKKSNLENSLIQESVKYNPHDVNAVMRFIDSEKVVDETGEVNTTALSAELQRIKTEMPYLFKPETTSNAGNSQGGNPSGTSGVIYKESQLRDSEFVALNIKDIKQAQKEGRILKGQ